MDSDSKEVKMQEAEKREEASSEGVLLYYSYARVDDPEELKAWLEAASKGLVGRVRISREGVNGTLGGSIDLLRKYIQVTKEGKPEVFAEVDFRVDELTEPKDVARLHDDRLRKECGFDTLRHRIVEEIVTYRRADMPRSKENYIHRLDHKQWEEALSRPGATFIDVRNIYESSIGRFVSPKDGATVICPDIRCTSDMSQWLSHIEASDIHLYCTGGVRCERAADILVQRLHKPVSLLEGGILNYLKASPNSRFFGRLFVFDPRVSIEAPRPLDELSRTSFCVGPACHGQHTPVSDYFRDDSPSPGDGAPPRPRCARCRILVLACDHCVSATPHLLFCAACRDNIHNER